MRNKIITIFIIIILLIMISFNCDGVQKQEVQLLTYQETNEPIQNPDKGFYYPMPIICQPTGMKKQGSIYRAESLVHLRIGLKAFSAKANKQKDYDITPEVLEVLDSYLEEVRQKGGTVIIRFAYDNFEGIPNLEPEIEQIEKHITQLTPFFVNNADVITSVETGFLGPYGEQHTSTIVTKENIKKVVDALLIAVPKERTIAVRKPEWYCAASGTILDTIDTEKTTPDNPYYRVGIFNDGYLGSASDLGTYRNRNKEIAWLSHQATHTIFGGEAVKVDSIHDTDENGNLYHSPEHIEQEMFLTHTSYLNEYWNDQLIESWKNTLYQGTDERYVGKTNFEYIQNHLGYQFVLQKAQIPYQVKQNENLSFEFTIQNVGAGNVVNPKDMYVILKKDGTEYTFLIQEDITTILSKQTKTIVVNLPIPKEAVLGEYEINIKIVNKGESVDVTKRCIQFANENTWNTVIAANQLGKIRILSRTVKEDKNEITNEAQNEVQNEIVNSVTNEIQNNVDPEITNTIQNQVENFIDKEGTVSNIIHNNIQDSTKDIQQDSSVAPTNIPQTGEEKVDVIMIGLAIFLIIEIIITIRYGYQIKK